ncbi:MAG TPA: LLM class F420-dependent oxidoreductase [Acidimicrobiia bacterium]|nr:LLM class F420-dependent oxidoreductase [Acidimicrobiia bacterium]
MDLGPVGIWTFCLDGQPSARAREIAAELESLGYGSLWIPEVMGRDPFVAASGLLAGTERLVVGTGIASVWARDALAMKSAWYTVEEAHPDRFILGLGVSHQPFVDGMRAATYEKPLSKMRAYLDAMDMAPFAASPPTTTPKRVLAALGPKMLALAGEKTDGAHPYNGTPEHTAAAREIMGPGKLLAVEQKVVCVEDAAAAREIARGMLRVYTPLPNYANNWKRLGFTDDDLADGGNDRFVDTVVAWGSEDTIKRRVQAHLDAGADHVCIQVLTAEGFAARPIDEWRRLAPALTS